jgi:hypothetical protein
MRMYLLLQPPYLHLFLCHSRYPSVNLNSALIIRNDNDATRPDAAWDVVSGALPSGLTLTNDGRVTGTPLEGGTFNVTVQVAYKLKTARTSFSVIVSKGNIILKDGYRSWEDGSVANSCKVP